MTNLSLSGIKVIDFTGVQAGPACTQMLAWFASAAAGWTSGSSVGLEGTVTSGVISALNRPVSSVGGSTDQVPVFDAIQTDTPMNPGNSGGALVTMNGQLIGMNSAIAMLINSPAAQSGSIGLGFAIPVDQAKRVAEELIATGTVAHASLGVEVNDDLSIPGARIVDVANGGQRLKLACLPARWSARSTADWSIAVTHLVAAVGSKSPAIR